MAAPSSMAREVCLTAAVALSFTVPPLSAQQLPQDIPWPATGHSAPTRTISLLMPPEISIGSGDGSEHELFSGIVGAVLLRNGGIAIADGSANRIQFFDSRGNFQQSLGRSGDGPGEYRFLRWFGRCGSDALGAYNGAPPSMTLISGAGVVNGRISLPASVRFQQPIACNDATGVMFLQQGPSAAQPPGQFLTTSAAVTRAQVGKIDTLAAAAGQIYYFSSRSRGAFADVPLQGTMFAASGPTRIFVAGSVHDSVRVLDMNGREYSGFSLDLRRVPITRAHWDRAVADRRAREPREQTRAIIDTVLGEVAPPRSLPYIADIAADAADNLWVRTFDGFLTRYGTWLVVTADGRPVARVVAPRSLRPLEIGRDYLIGVTQDEDGVESVHLYRFAAIISPG